MFLKVMHATTLADGLYEDEIPYSLYDDVTSCHFKRQPDGSAMAHIWCREPIKTAEVSGFSEVEKNVNLTGDAFLMNSQGRTVSKFLLRSEQRLLGQSVSCDQEKLLSIAKSVMDPVLRDVFYKALPYWVAVGLRKLTGCMARGTINDDFDRLRIAVDA